MKSFLIALLAGCAISAVAQTEPPVSRAEASAVFQKAERVMKAVLRYTEKVPPFPTTSGTATRAEILKHFLAIYRALTSKFKFTPPGQKPLLAIMSIKDPDSKKAAERLESLGFMDRYGPLATSKNEGLLPGEFGDAVGFFIARVAELSHTPSAKFSPFLMRG
jgi:hypothetical protein